MFRRPRNSSSSPSSSRSGTTPGHSQGGESGNKSLSLDFSRTLTEMLNKPTLAGVLENALAQAATLLSSDEKLGSDGKGTEAAEAKDSDIRGFAVIRRGRDEISAVLGYPRSLLGLKLSGPWSAMNTRLLTDGSSELYESNPSDLHRHLDIAGMRDVQLSLVVPITNKSQKLGALVLDRTSGTGMTPQQQEEITRLGMAVGPLLGVLESRDEWNRAARQITSAAVEAVESRDFDRLGHAQAVAEIAVKMGRMMSLTGTEMEVLWFAATLHDLGKIHGEAGHALVSANFLHGVPHLAEAQKAIRHHHEKWNGTGEPDGLAGENIPLYARILAIADTYVNGGPERVKAEAGVSLDPAGVAILEQVMGQG